jgi:hypothetical protein
LQGSAGLPQSTTLNVGEPEREMWHGFFAALLGHQHDLLSCCAASCRHLPTRAFLHCLDQVQRPQTPFPMPVFLDNAGRDQDSRIESIKAKPLPNLGSTQEATDGEKYDAIVAGASSL